MSNWRAGPLKGAAIRTKELFGEGRLAGQTALRVALVTLAVTLGGLAWEAHDLVARTRSDYDLLQRYVREDVRATLAPFLLRRDPELAQGAADALVSTHKIWSLSVVDSLGAPFVSAHRLQSGEEGILGRLTRTWLDLEPIQAVPILAPGRGFERVMGSLTVRYDLRALMSDVTSDLGRRAVFALVMVGLTALVLAVSQHLFLSRRIIDLGRSLGDLDLKDPQSHVLPMPPGHGGNELGGLVRAYNGALAQLAENADSLRVMATKDPLTGLPNRALLHDLIEDAIEARRREGKCCAVFFLDLDRFKDINDSFGYRGGDALLRTIGERLRTSIGDQGAVGRLGGDEYLILINGLGEREALADIARRLIEVVGHPMEVDGTFARLNTSIGIARYPQDGERAEDLVSAADTAMHAAKARGRGEWSFFEKEMTEVAITRIQTETALRAGLSCGEFVVHYQPKLDLRSGLVSGAEALVRWRRDGVLVPPSRFIPIAEETGLIKELGLMVLADACDFIARRLDEGRPLAVAVNVSAVQLRDPGFLEDVMTLVGKRCPKPSLLELEITESAIMSQLDVRLRVLEQLRLMGICLAVDDFGTGYSSLSYLKRLPVDVLKIDRSFVVDLPNDTSIPRMILNLAAQLKLNTVAEGVERQDQLDWLRTMNCTMAQGYLIGRPGPAGDLDRCPVLSPYPSLSPPCEG